jgi:glycosyltransferase involved in cell wall biosynthesis
MRFAFISTMTGWNWGGSEELWGQTALHLKRGGHDVHASVMQWPKLSPKLTALVEEGVKLGTYPRGGGGYLKRIYTKFSRARLKSYARIKQFKPDLVIISQGHNAGGFDWARVCREASIPYVLIVHCNSEHLWFPDWDLDEAVESYRCAEKVYCVSHGNLNLLRMQLGDPIPKGEVIWNPYNVSPEGVPAWPVENGLWRLACVARLDPAAKGQELLLQILARPEWRARPMELNLFGEGPYERTLRRLAEMLQLKQVHFRGHVANIKAIWEQNHLLVLPSRYEGLPLVIVESMWCGRPAVVTDVAGNAEVCADNETGFVAPAPTVSSLADTLQRAWDRREEWQRMGQAARARAESLIPKNPITLFAEKLSSCAAEAYQVSTSTNPR